MNSKSKKVRIRRNSRPYQILKYLVLGSGVLILSTISPAAGAQLLKAGLRAYFRNKKFEQYRFLRDLKNLQTRELLRYRELDGNKMEIILTQRGKEKMLVYQIDDMQLTRTKRWDGKWRLIMFDIPHSYKKARDAFRRKLMDLKFYPLQKSVFITPYPCEDEIDFIALVFDVRKYILILYVNHFEGEKKLKHYFGI